MTDQVRESLIVEVAIDEMHLIGDPEGAGEFLQFLSISITLMTVDFWMR